MATAVRSTGVVGEYIANYNNFTVHIVYCFTMIFRFYRKCGDDIFKPTIRRYIIIVLADCVPIELSANSVGEQPHYYQLRLLNNISRLPPDSDGFSLKKKIKNSAVVGRPYISHSTIEIIMVRIIKTYSKSVH